MILAALLYLFAIVLIAVLEFRRISKSSADIFTIFLIVFNIQIMIPACALLFLASGGEHIVAYSRFITEVINTIEPTHGYATLIFSLYFLVTTFAVWKFLDEKLILTAPVRVRFIVDVSIVRWALVMAMGVFSMYILLNMLGSNLLESYKNLLIMRSAQIGRTFITAKLFSLAQTFAIVSSIGILFARSRKRNVILIISIALAVLFSFMTGARRTLGITLLIVYFSIILFENRFYIMRWLLPLSAILSPLIMFGERIASAFAFQNGVSVTKIIEFPSKGDIAVLFGEIGISVLESWATFMDLHMPMRFGVDHLLSIARRFPEGFLGIPFEFPERIVRISTAAFMGESALDVPPGLLGQMWLDARFLGPIMWGVFFGLQLATLQYIYKRSRMSLAATGVLNCVLFIVLLPLNTGSFDFSFNIDMMMLMIFSFWIIRVKILKEHY